MRCLVTGAAGFVGHHLARRLRADGHWVRGVDWRYSDEGHAACDEFHVRDLRSQFSAGKMTHQVDWVFDLAADMGGMGYIHEHTGDLMLNNTQINTNVLHRSLQAGVSRYLFTSSACVYNETLQTDPANPGLCEADAFPAQPDTAYGWQKLYHELLCRYHADRLDCRVVRLHNVYGPEGTWDGGREKAPAALCRKIALAKLTGATDIDVWGDGEQTRTFLYVDDCLDGLLAAMTRPDAAPPVNLGSTELVSINQLAAKIMDIAGWRGVMRHDLTKPQGVRGRSSDNTLVTATLGWSPKVSLDDGLALTYRWIEEQVRQRHA